MKKWLVFILLLVTTAGVLIPCCSVDDCCAEQVTNTASHDAHQDGGSCSPFFACATCPVFAEVSKPFQFTEPVAVKAIHHAFPSIFNLPSFSASFWQPPRHC